MAITRVPIVTGIDPEQSGGGDVSKGSLAKNIVYNKYVDGRTYATQRAAINIDGIAALFDVPPCGRGITYWDAISQYVIINNDTVYLNSYGGALANKISPGRDPVTLLELGDYVIILDRENNEGWYIKSDTPTTVSKITDADFPANIPGKKLAAGGAVLNGYLFVMTTDGFVYNSDLNNPISWNAIDFISSQRDVDEGVFLTRHHDNLCAIGAKTITFYYDNGNAVGSPLQPRLDIAYSVGAVDFKSVFNTGNNIYFIGSEKVGTAGLWEIIQFNLTKVSNDSIDYYLSNTRARSQFSFSISGNSIGDHQLIYITSLSPAVTTDSIDYWDPQYTLVFDSYSKTFTQFETTIATIKAFSVVSASERSTVREKESVIQFFSGDFGQYDLTFSKLDASSYDAQYVDPDYIVNQDDYVYNLGQDTSSTFEAILLTGESDFGSVTNKFQYRLSIVGTTTAAAADQTPIMVSWTDDHYRTFSPERSLSTGLNRSLTRGGTFRRRAFKMRYTGQDVIRIEGIEADIRASQYA